MKKLNLKFILSLGTLLLIGICVILTIMLYFPQKARAVHSRPLVLIHEPLNREHITLGERALVNATARNSRGIRRVELWDNGTFYFAQEASPDGTMPSLALMSPWEPTSAGEHTLVVRAFSKDGVDGQASIRVWVAEPEISEQASTEEGMVEEGAEASSSTAPGSSSSPGGSPGVSPPSGGAPAPAADEPAPSPAGSEPGSVDDLTEDVGLDLLEPADTLPAEPTSIKIEALALETETDFEALHCYIGLGDLDPRWYPDADHDQSTDETFALIGDGLWNVAEYLSGDQAPAFMWPADQAIPFNVNCVGIISGGTDSIPLGRIDVLAEPDTWDGSPRRLESSGGEGLFTLEYRIGNTGGSGMGFPLILDPSIPPPFNLRTEGFYELHWDWEPSSDSEPEEPIDGFYIYVNNTLQFALYGEDERSIILPPEWFNPPCGIAYEITISAWRWNFDDHTDNFESYPSESYVIERDALTECDIAAYVTFETLNISHYGVDEIGPAMLMFNVNSAGASHTLQLDGFCRDGGMCDGLMLSPDRAYDVGWLMRIDDMPNYVQVPLTEEGLGLSMIIFDQHDDGSDLVCEGVIHVPGDEIFTPEGFDYLGILTSRIPDERCEVSFSIRSELITSSYDGLSFPPLPQLGVDEIIIDEGTGQYWINVHNYSSGTWANDLRVSMTRNSGEYLDYFTLPDFVLLPGGETNIFDPEMPTIDRPLDLCVTLDPENDVLESVERDNPGWTAGPYCLDAPDLTITSAGFASDDRTLVVTVQNRGEAPYELSRVALRVEQRGPAPAQDFSGYVGDDGLGPWESQVIELPVLENSIRSYGLRTNFSVTVDPEDYITESDESNNTFSLSEGAKHVRLYWNGFNYDDLEPHLSGPTYSGLSVTYYPAEDEHNYDYFHAIVNIENGVEAREITRFDYGCTVVRGIEYGGYDHYCLSVRPSANLERSPQVTFDLAHGEWVTISISGDLYADDAELSGSTRGHHELGGFTLRFTSDEIESLPPCEERLPMGITHWGYVYPPEFDISLFPWYAGFTMCSVGE